MRVYRKELRGNPAAWTQKIEQIAETVRMNLANSGLTEDMIAQAHPYDIAVSYAIKYSARLEGLLREDEEMANERYLEERATRFSLTSPDGDDEEDDEEQRLPGFE